MTQRLLVRDLAQVATPAGAHAPLRGSPLGEVDVLEHAFVLCSAGTIETVGLMANLPALDDDVVELDGRGLCAIPGLVDCHTHAAFGGDRVDEFSLRAGGASYEELHAAGGGILSVSDALHTANIALLGNYLASTFVASSDGHGGTVVVDPVLGASPPADLTQPQHS